MQSDDIKIQLPCTDSVRQILLSAQAQASADDRSQVSSQDLLTAFCNESEGIARRLLEGLGIRVIELGSRLFLDDGILDSAQFGPAVWGTLQSALQCARDKGHDAVGRTHVIYAMLLMAESTLARKAREQNQDPVRLAGMIYSGLSAGNLEGSDLELRAACIKAELRYVLCIAEKEMRDKNERTMRDRTLLRILARDGGGPAGGFLEGYGFRWRH